MDERIKAQVGALVNKPEQPPGPPRMVAREPVDFAWAVGGDADRRIVALVIQTATGEGEYLMPVDKAEKIKEGLEGAIRRVRSGLIVSS